MTIIGIATIILFGGYYLYIHPEILNPPYSCPLGQHLVGSACKPDFETNNDAQSMYSKTSYIVPRSIKIWVALIPNESHEDYPDESNKFVSDKNPQMLPQNLILHYGQGVAFYHADAPWDSHHTHVVIMRNGTGQEVWRKEPLGYPFYNKGPSLSSIKILEPGDYTLSQLADGHKIKIKATTIKVLNEPMEKGASMISGAFYTPTNPVYDPKDNDGGIHYGNLAFYQQQLAAHQWTITSTYDFTYAANNGSYWPDNKTTQHTLVIWQANKEVDKVKADLDAFTRENTYI